MHVRRESVARLKAGVILPEGLRRHKSHALYIYHSMATPGHSTGIRRYVVDAST